MNTKNKPSKLDQLIRSQLSSQENDNIEISAPKQPLVPGGLLTLLDVPHRKPLPEIPNQVGRRSLLHDIIEYTPDTYVEFIMLIRGGAYFHVAAEACGIGESTLYEWARRGRDALALDEDSYYTRFLLDVRRAVAYCRSSCEVTLRELDPKKWLTLGPGRIFGKEWVETTQQSNSNDKSPLDSKKEFLDTVLDEKPQITSEKSASDMMVKDLSPQQELDAILALEAAGQGSWPEEFKESLRKQIRS